MMGVTAAMSTLRVVEVVEQPTLRVLIAAL